MWTTAIVDGEWTIFSSRRPRTFNTPVVGWTSTCYVMASGSTPVVTDPCLLPTAVQDECNAPASLRLLVGYTRLNPRPAFPSSAHKCTMIQMLVTNCLTGVLWWTEQSGDWQSNYSVWQQSSFHSNLYRATDKSSPSTFVSPNEKGTLKNAAFKSTELTFDCRREHIKKGASKTTQANMDGYVNQVILRVIICIELAGLSDLIIKTIIKAT